jgi:hypothetical protein
VRENAGWNGLDYVEVDNAQTTLTVYFLGKAPDTITKKNVRIEGGRTARDRVAILFVDVVRNESAYLDDYMRVQVDKPGDYSSYTLSVVGLEKIDPRYASVEFSFKANCPSDLDCAPSCRCEPPQFETPAIDYLAKDYAGFRQLILDRLALICPDWKERHVPDIGIVIVEVLAYIADYLSYYQDAVATEAYLNTARRRPSVRRHARLVDYFLSEGCNARALVAVEVSSDISFHAQDASFITGVNHVIPIGDRTALQERELGSVAANAYEVFLPVAGEEIQLWVANNAISFYTWGERECCLAKDATSATLSGDLESVHLAPGDYVIFEEVMGPVTGDKYDADPQHRQAVRLTRVTGSRDELLNQSIIEIEWREEDALRFALCISAIGAAPECRYLENITVARANVVLVDHGRWIGPQDLGSVPAKQSIQCCECEGQPSETTTIAGRFRPSLSREPLTFRAPFRDSDSAVGLFAPDATEAVPVVMLESSEGDWSAQPDLFGSTDSDNHFVVEMEEDGTANIRFGDGELGHQPAPASSFTARYRIGNGTTGNVGAGAISLLVHKESNLSNDISRVWNPLPAGGGTAPEPMSEAKLNAPYAFRFGPTALQRAIIADDYATIAGRNAKIQRAAARLVWTGSWFEAEVGIDAKAAYASQVDALAAEIETYLDDYRRIGHDLDVRAAEYVAIDLALDICIAPEYLRGQVKAALLDAFSNRALADGAEGFFHPDRLTFGDDIYLSAILAAAHAVTGVTAARVKRLQRQFEASNQEIENGVLPLGPFQIARLDNDPNWPDRGKLEINVAGGR